MWVTAPWARQTSGTRQPIPRSMHHTPAPRCCTHMHAAQPKRPLPFTALSHDDPAKTSQPTDYLVLSAYLQGAWCAVFLSYVCRVAWHSSAGKGGLPMPCRRISAVQGRSIRSRYCSPEPENPRASLAAGAISRQDKRARIIPTVGINAANSAMPMHTVVPPNLNMRAGVGGWWEVMDQAGAAHHLFCCPGREQVLADERSSD